MPRDVEKELKAKGISNTLGQEKSKVEAPIVDRHLDEAKKKAAEDAREKTQKAEAEAAAKAKAEFEAANPAPEAPQAEEAAPADEATVPEEKHDKKKTKKNK